MELTAIGAASSWLKDGGWKWVAGVLTTLIAAATIWYLSTALHSARTELSSAKTTIAARDGEITLLRQARAADAASEKVREASVATAAKQATERRTRTDAALKANPDWADQPVPSAVSDSLRQ